MAYTFDQIVSAYREAGVEAGRTVYVGSQLWRLMEFDGPTDGAAAAHLDALTGLVGDSGTVVTFAGSMNLVNTRIPFDPASTPSYQCGAFAECVRLHMHAFRSFHPFGSFAAIGGRAAEITRNTSRHPYGGETPWDRMLDEDTLILSIGAPPNTTSNIVHHVEMTMGVPYRYTKEFIHPVLRDGAVSDELYYLFVWYRDTDMLYGDNRRLFGRLEGRVDIRRVPLGRGAVYAYSARPFFREAKKVIADDIYVWCKQAPTIRPFRE
ncbi:MAG: AAC(3) family N-acetyltransferase [Magnetospirillum sp.]|nr:AAC(3) family N-acetyltransferase [Magnetospirillum sp.]